MWIPLRFASQCCSCLFRTTVSELPEVPASSLAASLFTVMARWTDHPSRGKSQVWARFNFPPDMTSKRKPAMSSFAAAAAKLDIAGFRLEVLSGGKLNLAHTWDFPLDGRSVQRAITVKRLAASEDAGTSGNSETVVLKRHEQH